MASRKLNEGERIFDVRLVIRKDKSSTVIIQELGDPNKASYSTPVGEFGVREGLRIAGNAVRELYRSEQRRLFLEERARAVAARRTETKAKPPAKPKPKPKVDGQGELAAAPPVEQEHA